MCPGLFSASSYLVEIMILEPAIKIPDYATGKARIAHKTPRSPIPSFREDLVAACSVRHIRVHYLYKTLAGIWCPRQSC